MPKFTTRVELHDAGENDYEILHAAMRDKNFYRVIIDSTTNQIFQLPRAEYNSQGDLTKEQVLDFAVEAARVTQRQFSIVVTQSNGRIFYNLDEVHEVF